MELPSLTEDQFLALLKRLQGSGYTEDPDSKRVAELQAVARVAALASEGLGALGRNLFMQSADEALDALERVRFLVGSATLTTARRRRRLLAFAQGTGKLVEARLSNALANYLGSSAGQTVSPDVARTTAHGASPRSTLVVGRLEPSADKHAARDLDPVLARGLPSRALAGGVAQAELTYGAALDGSPLAIGLEPSVAIVVQTKARAAPIEAYPGQVVTPDAWIELQSMLLWKSRGFTLDQAQQGRTALRTLALAGSASTSVGGPSWAGRLLSAWGAVRADDADDDLAASLASECVWLATSKLGAAGSGPTHTLAHLDGTPSDITVHVAGDGTLTVTNTGVAARLVTLLLSSTPVYGEGTTTDTQPWASTSVIAHDALAELYAGLVISDATPGSFSGAPAGALRRVVYTGGLTRELGADRVRHVVLDSSEDYRRRYLLVAPLTFGVGLGVDPAHYPAASADGLSPRFSALSAPRLFYTGDGAAQGQDEQLPYQHPDGLDAPDIWLFSDDDGNLCAEMKETLSTHKSACLMALILGTEQVGGDSVVTPVPVHATRVQTLDLEQPQNCGVYAQGFQGGVPRLSRSDPAPRTVPTCPPLGLISEGSLPLRPIAFTVRERLGAIDDGTYEARQKIVGQRRRIVSLALAAGALTPVDAFNVATELAPGVNDQVDFRDRLVVVEGRWSTSDIRIGAVAQTADTAATAFFVAFYAGPYADVEVPITSTLSMYFEFSRSAEHGGYHSRLCFRNTGEDEVFANATITCSGFVGLTDLRQYGVINAFTYSDHPDESMYDDENLAYSDDFGVAGGPYRGQE